MADGRLNLYGWLVYLHHKETIIDFRNKFSCFCKFQWFPICARLESCLYSNVMAQRYNRVASAKAILDKLFFSSKPEINFLIFAPSKKRYKVESWNVQQWKMRFLLPVKSDWQALREERKRPLVDLIFGVVKHTFSKAQNLQ